MYLLRLDDASPHWNRGNWDRMHDLLQEYGIRPIIAIIPDNRDDELLAYPEDDHFLQTVRGWINEGWTPAQHGLHHTPTYPCKGINPVSEFAGAPLSEQKDSIRSGYEILRDDEIECRIFVAPYHTFDDNTVRAVREVTNIKAISDTVARDVYLKDGLYFIPQQSGRVQRLPFALTTFCYHPNVMDDRDFSTLEAFLLLYQSMFTSFSQIQLKDRRYDVLDWFLARLYKLRHVFS